MNFLKNLVNWGHDAWNFLAGLPGDVSNAMRHLWHYITSVHDLMSWLVRIPILGSIIGLVGLVRIQLHVITDILAAIDRIAIWVDNMLVAPLRRQVIKWIDQLAAKEARDVRMLIADDIQGLREAEAYTDRQVGIERKQRIADVKAARAYALALVTAALKAVQNEAASGYQAGLSDRLGVVGKILDDLATRNPAVRGLVAALVQGVIDLLGTENPVARLVLSVVLKRIVSQVGIDHFAGDLAGRLLSPLVDDPKPKTLHDVVHDICKRLTALEDQWATFMIDGGPEVEQAGQEWKSITSVAADAALLGMFGLAVADPRAWATGVADTLGVAANDAITGVVKLIERA